MGGRAAHAGWTLLLSAGSMYLTAALLGFVFRMAMYPTERWMGGLAWTLLHAVIAASMILAGARARRDRRRAQPLIARESVGTALVLYSIGAVIISTWLAFAIAPTFLAWRLGIRRPQYAVRIERGTGFTTADGIQLRADLYLPRRLERAPTVLVRTATPRTRLNVVLTDLVGRLWAERGYVAVIQGVRGRYGSGGEFYPLRHERQDGQETLDWLARQAWFNGRIAMWGSSYAGFTQWAAGDHAQALGIQLSASSYYDLFYRGGAFQLETALHWAMQTAGSRDVTPPPHRLQRGYDAFPMIEADNRAGRDSTMFNDWLSHPERDEYWQQMEAGGIPRSPVLMMAGWYDPFLPAQLADWQRLQQEAGNNVAMESRLIIGPWAHEETVVFPRGVKPRGFRWESVAPSVAWFDRQLRVATPSHPMAPVRIYVMGAYQWRDEQEWPLARAIPTEYFLGSKGNAHSVNGGGVLLTEPPIAAGPPAVPATPTAPGLPPVPPLPATTVPPDVFDYNPRQPVLSTGGAVLGPRAGIALQNDIENRPDVLVYTAPVLDSDLEVTGPLQLILYVSTYAPSTDFTAKLVDVHPDGAAFLVTDGILRRRYFDTNKPHGPCPVTQITIDLWPTSMVFRKGHRIRLEVSSSNYPRFDRNLNTGAALAVEMRTEAVRQAVYHAPEYPSRLVLPVIATSGRTP